MKKTYHTTEQIIRLLRETEAGGQSNEAVCRKHNISPQTFYRWKSQYGGMGCSGRAVCRWLSIRRGTFNQRPKALPERNLNGFRRGSR